MIDGITLRGQADLAPLLDRLGLDPAAGWPYLANSARAENCPYGAASTSAEKWTPDPDLAREWRLLGREGLNFRVTHPDPEGNPSLAATLTVKGSIHRYARGGGHNGDTLTLPELRDAVERLSEYVGIPSDLLTLSKREQGVNAEVPAPFTASGVIAGLYGHRGDAVTVDKAGGNLTVRRDKYAIKIYDKGQQLRRVHGVADAPDNLLRIEIDAHASWWRASDVRALRAVDIYDPAALYAGALKVLAVVEQLRAVPLDIRDGHAVTGGEPIAHMRRRWGSLTTTAERKKYARGVARLYEGVGLFCARKIVTGLFGRESARQLAQPAVSTSPRARAGKSGEVDTGPVAISTVRSTAPYGGSPTLQQESAQPHTVQSQMRSDQPTISQVRAPTQIAPPPADGSASISTTTAASVDHSHRSTLLPVTHHRPRIRIRHPEPSVDRRGFIARGVVDNPTAASYERSQRLQFLEKHGVDSAYVTPVMQQLHAEGRCCVCERSLENPARLTCSRACRNAKSNAVHDVAKQLLGHLRHHPEHEDRVSAAVILAHVDARRDRYARSARRRAAPAPDLFSAVSTATGGSD